MLELTFYSKVDWGSYSIFITNTHFKKIGALICSRKFLSPEVALCFFQSNIWPCMEYYVWTGGPICFLEL